MTRTLQPAKRARPLHPHGKSIAELCHKPGRYLQKMHLRCNNGRRLTRYTIEPEGLVVDEEHALEAIVKHLIPRDLDLLGQPATWKARP